MIYLAFYLYDCTFFKIIPKFCGCDSQNEEDEIKV